MKRSLSLVAACLVVGLSHTSLADDDFDAAFADDEGLALGSSRQAVDAEALELVHEPEPAGRTMLRVLAPEGAVVRLSGPGRPVRDTVPASFDVRAGHFYRVEVLLEGRLILDRKVEAKAGMRADLRLPNGNGTRTGEAALTCLPEATLRSIRAELRRVVFDDEKVKLLRASIAGRGVCVAQAQELLRLFSFSEEKLAALEVLAARLVDRDAAMNLLNAFDFDSDRRRARTVLQK